MQVSIFLDQRAKKAEREIIHLHRAFFGTEPLLLEMDADDAFTITLEDGHPEMVATIEKQSVSYLYEMKIDPGRCFYSTKQIVSHLFVKAIEQLHDKQLPWGILTGIRPLKLYRKLIDSYSREEAERRLTDFYLMKHSKVQLLRQVHGIQQPIIKDIVALNQQGNGSVSLYLGIPYCPSKCSYCTFSGYFNRSEEEKVAYFSCLLKEVAAVMEWTVKHQLNIASVYIGGGTPSTLTAYQIKELLTALGVTKELTYSEVTFEAGRPDSLTAEKLSIMKMSGVDRISINPQTFSQQTLTKINRRHTPKDIVDIYRIAREIGFMHINMDIILGLPGEELKDVQETLRMLAELQPDGVTIHTLALKTKSELKQQYTAEQFRFAQQIDAMLAHSQQWAQQQGYLPYYVYRQKNISGNFENVGYAKVGKHSLYNIYSMEEVMPIIGIGCGAVSKLINQRALIHERLANPVEPRYYIETIDQIIDKKQKLLPLILTNR